MAPTPAAIDGKKEPIRFSRLDPAKLHQNKVFLVLGPRGSGKSVMIKCLLYHMRNRFEFVIAFFGTQDTVSEFKGIIPDCFIYEGIRSFNPEMLSTILTLQEKWKEMARVHQDPVNWKIKSVLVLLDDMMVDKNWLKSEVMGNLHNNGRHQGMTIMNGAQYMMEVPPTIRSQIDYAIIFYKSDDDWIRKVHENFVGGLVDKKSFPIIYKKITEDRCAMVIDNTVKTNVMTDCIKCFKAKLDVGPFTLGSDQMWRLSLMFTKREEQRKAEVMREYENCATNILDMRFRRCAALRDGRIVGRGKSPKEGVAAPKRKAPARTRAGTERRGNKRATVVHDAFRLDGADISVVTDEI